MDKLAKRIIVYGRVQGVGFRPSVCRLAEKWALQGYVRNLGGIVEIVAAGSLVAYENFKQELLLLLEPVLVERIEEAAIALDTFTSLWEQNLKISANPQLNFFSVASAGTPQQAVLPADIGLCPDCLAEMVNLSNRRYRYPYISCAQCGPRYTIIDKLPYDRENTSMKKFDMCKSCNNEYFDMQDRRGHAETISCWDCGPQITGYVKNTQKSLRDIEAIDTAKQLLLEDKIIMVKAVGGFNLICRADKLPVVAQLRQLKQRLSKPLAIMCKNIEVVEKLCELSAREKELLESSVRPIVLLNRKDNKQIASNVSNGTPRLGVFLPPMGLYYQLCSMGVPLIVTSCNHSGVPIIYKDEEAVQFYQEHEEIAGLFTYDREILRPADDAVVTDKQILRRTKGFMPEPITLEKLSCDNQVLAVGAQMEPGFCLSVGNKIYPAQIPGELEEEETEALWLNSVKDWQKLLNIKPNVVVGDLHPGYSSTLLGENISKEINGELLQVQHHHAHALAVIAEHELEGKTLAVCFDGTGYGLDGTVWGGEFLLCEGTEFTRLAHLEAVPMLGGDASMKQAWKSMLCYLAQWEKQLGDTKLNFDSCYEVVKAALAGNINVIANSSMGRLFDAVAAILGIADFNSHQGRCAQALESLATEAIKEKIEPLSLCFKQLQTKEDLVWSTESIWTVLLEARQKLQAFETQQERESLQKAVALGFHKAIINMVTETAKYAYTEYGVKQIVLGGGCFANNVLLKGCVKALENLNFKVYYNQKVPPGDGGIALGQAYYGMLKSKLNRKA